MIILALIEGWRKGTVHPVQSMKGDLTGPLGQMTRLILYFLEPIKSLKISTTSKISLTQVNAVYLRVKSEVF